MSKTTSVALGDHFREYAERKVREGRYGSTSEVIRAGLRLLEDEEKRLEALRAALIEGEESGLATEFDLNAFLAEMHTRHLRKSA
ncbi:MULTISPECIES: type II toxin-antitoxin system ParD family antitoxin [unclassified Sphingobium]|uniref:type II toxin-antitoxin system ParD family antitoxin n=1 Tax=unclassified Sphingobium TaxID=2611147 RepID=UPI0035A71215